VQTKDQEFLKKWKAKIGEAKAEEIKNLSSRRGTAMHKYLECYIESKGYEDLTDIGVQAKPMAQKIIDIGLAPVDEYYGSEVTLYYPGLYAGSTDLVCRHNGMDTIIDFKQANRPKNKDWIDDYYLQIAAYCMAHDYVYNSQIQQGIIMVCTPDLYFQEFKFQDHELRQWKHKFLKRLDMYHELMHSEKQTKEPMKEEEFKK
jgi:ATP-dependent exoDNAse (exonuclease V) beta subunit